MYKNSLALNTNLLLFRCASEVPQTQMSSERWQHWITDLVSNSVFPATLHEIIQENINVNV